MFGFCRTRLHFGSVPTKYRPVTWACHLEGGDILLGIWMTQFRNKKLRYFYYFAGEQPDDDQLLKSPHDGSGEAPTNLFLYQVIIWTITDNLPTSSCIVHYGHFTGVLWLFYTSCLSIDLKCDSRRLILWNIHIPVKVRLHFLFCYVDKLLLVVELVIITSFYIT